MVKFLVVVLFSLGSHMKTYLTAGNAMSSVYVSPPCCLPSRFRDDTSLVFAPSVGEFLYVCMICHVIFCLVLWKFFFR